MNKFGVQMKKKQMIQEFPFIELFLIVCVFVFGGVGMLVCWKRTFFLDIKNNSLQNEPSTR